MIPDAEAVVAAYLRDDEDLGELVGDRVGASTPDTTATPWIEVSLVNPEAVGAGETDTLTRFMLTLNCYGGDDPDVDQEEASDVMRRARAALVAMPTVDLGDVTATAVRFGAAPRIPDEDFTPARQRYAMDVFVYLKAR